MEETVSEAVLCIICNPPCDPCTGCLLITALQAVTTGLYLARLAPPGRCTETQAPAPAPALTRTRITLVTSITIISSLCNFISTKARNNQQAIKMSDIKTFILHRSKFSE